VTTLPSIAASRTFGIGPEKMSDGFVYQNLRFLGYAGDMAVTWADSASKHGVLREDAMWAFDPFHL
jgi:hypothetical protein